MTIETRLACLQKAIEDEVELLRIDRRIEDLAHGLMQYQTIDRHTASYYFPQVAMGTAMGTVGLFSGIVITPMAIHLSVAPQNNAVPETPAPTAPPPKPTSPNQRESRSAESLFSTAKSPGSMAVCAAEGNCGTDGSKTSIYLGHIDPGNHVVNRGFCSWNKAASLSVDEADKRCMKALQWQATKTQQHLEEFGINDNPEAIVQGTDLWNQSNSAGPQFTSKYKMALTQGMTGSKAYLWARVEAFRRWSGTLDANGLFSICTTQPYYIPRLRQYSEYSESWRWQCIALDQKRRIKQIEKVLESQKREMQANNFFVALRNAIARVW